MGNVRSASNAWATIKKKIMARGGGVGAGSEAGASTPTKATPKKRAKKAVEGGDYEETAASPKKMAKTSKKSNVKVEEEEKEASEATTAIKGEEDGMEEGF
jgi:hypothetical protein